MKCPECGDTDIRPMRMIDCRTNQPKLIVCQEEEIHNVASMRLCCCSFGHRFSAIEARYADNTLMDGELDEFTVSMWLTEGGGV